MQETFDITLIAHGMGAQQEVPFRNINSLSVCILTGTAGFVIGILVGFAL